MIPTNKKKRVRLGAIVVLLLIIGSIYLFLIPGSAEMDGQEQLLRQEFLNTAATWLGCNESDGSHRAIIDLYNAHEPLAQGYRVQYDDAWCATFVSVVSIQCGLTDIIPTECGCQRQIELFKALDRWEENDAYAPLPGDIIYYSVEGAGIRSDNVGWADHVGIVVSRQGKLMKIIEGNHNHKVTYRYILMDDPRIRGYALPDFGSLSESNFNGRPNFGRPSVYSTIFTISPSLLSMFTSS